MREAYVAQSDWYAIAAKRSIVRIASPRGERLKRAMTAGRAFAVCEHWIGRLDLGDILNGLCCTFPGDNPPLPILLSLGSHAQFLGP